MSLRYLLKGTVLAGQERNRCREPKIRVRKNPERETRLERERESRESETQREPPRERESRLRRHWARGNVSRAGERERETAGGRDIDTTRAREHECLAEGERDNVSPGEAIRSERAIPFNATATLWRQQRESATPFA